MNKVVMRLLVIKSVRLVAAVDKLDFIGINIITSGGYLIAKDFTNVKLTHSNELPPLQ